MRPVLSACIIPLTMTSLLIEHGTVLDPASGLQQLADVYIEDGVIREIGPDLKAKIKSDVETLDATSLYVTPGLIDIHVHFREPGQEVKETVATGSAAAVAGGFTTVCCMPNTTPALDTDTQVEFIYTKAREAGLCHVLPIGAITKGRKGEELAEMALMHAAGAAGFSDDGVGVASAAVMTKALRLEWDDRDDPIVEVAAPENFSGRDFLDIGRRS